MATTFVNHIRDIVSLRTEKQTCFIVHTGGIVAVMQNVQSFRNRPMPYFPGYPMGQKISSSIFSNKTVAF